MDNLDLLLEDVDLLEAVENYEDLVLEYKMSDSVLSVKKLSDEEYVKRQIKNIKDGNIPLTWKEVIPFLAGAATLGYYSLPLALLYNVVMSVVLSGGFSKEKVDEKSKKRMLDSIDKAIQKMERTKLKDDADQKKLKAEIAKLKRNRELVEKKL